MLSDKKIGVADPARRMGRACAWAPARGFRLRLARSALAAAMASLLPLHAAAQEGQGATPEIEVDTMGAFDLPAGSLTTSLKAFSTQSGIRLEAQPGLLADKQARAVNGRMGWREALNQLLQGSGLEYRQTGDTTVVIATAGAGAASADGPARARPETTTSRAAATDLEAVTVTGTRIRGGTSPSPMITIGSENIREEGFSDLGEVIRSVPQNFSGGQNPGVLMANRTGGGMSNQNLTGGSSLNLRGLGPDASLTLLNGRRLSYSGTVQSVDISAIPVDAVERIEIVADGASAVYGSDAVGGVANVILKRDFDGAVVGARYGTATDGGLTTREYIATAGASWSSGGLIATYKNGSVDPIYAADRAYTNHLIEPTMLYPGSELRSGLLSAYQWFGDTVELRLDALRTEREQTYYYLFSGGTTIYSALTPKTTTSLIAPSIEFLMPNDWVLSVGGTWGDDELILNHKRVVIETGAVTPLFHECACNESRVYEVNAEGPLFAVGAGDARLAIGAGYRTNRFSWDNYLMGANNAQGKESSRFAYAEIDLPLVGAQSNVSGVERLGVTAAVRSEDYDSFGRVNTPKLGVIYGPSPDFTLKASWGRSFKAPTLFERNYNMMGHLFDPSAFGETDYDEGDTLLYLNGGNPDLAPERARTRTVSLAFHPEDLPGLSGELTWFDIDYTSRVMEPSVGSLNDPIYAEFIDRAPSAERLADIVGRLDAFYNYTAAPYDANRVITIVDVRYVNANRQRIKGIDLSGSYRLDLGPGQITIRGSSTWLDSTQQTKGTPRPYDLAGTRNNPPKVSSRAGIVWSQGELSVSVFGNFTGGVVNTVDGVKSASFTTFDTTLRYDTGRRNDSWSGVELALSLQNLLDRAAPFSVSDTPRYTPPYDSTNYSAIGRFVSASVSKRW